MKKPIPFVNEVYLEMNQMLESNGTNTETDTKTIVAVWSKTFVVFQKQQHKNHSEISELSKIVKDT